MNTAIAYTGSDTEDTKLHSNLNNVITTAKEPASSYQHTLRRIETTLNREMQRLDDAFALLGWHDLPDSLKTEIANDVSQMIDELNGHYSSIDPAVEQRRKAVYYWIDCYRQGICTRQTALEALRQVY